MIKGNVVAHLKRMFKNKLSSTEKCTESEILSMEPWTKILWIKL